MLWGRSCRPVALAAVALAGVSVVGCGGQESGAGTTATTVVPRAQSPDRDTFGQIPAIVRRVQSSVVAVLVSTGQGEAEGSGVIYRTDGVIVTNNHVVEGARSIRIVTAGGQELDGRVIATDPVTDIALVRVDRRGLPVASFARSLPQVGALAVAIGNPLGFQNTVTAGIVSGLHRAIPSGGQTPALVDLIQTDAPISPGNSGGALVSTSSTVIGINVAYIPPQEQAVSLGFAIPSATVVAVVSQLLRTGRVQHAFLGIQPAPVTPQLAEQFGLSVREGVLVLGVEPGRAAARGGIRRGDVIVRFANRAIDSVEDLFAALRSTQPGQRVPVTLVRGRDRRELSIVLDVRPG
jgi:S1-C subfamily serine protease